MDTFEIKDEKIDVEEIMSKIRENIKKRKESGAYSEEMEALIVKPSNLSFAEAKSGDPEQDLIYINDNWDVHVDYEISSHRPIIGRLLVLGRQFIHGEVKRFVDLITWKQNEFNEHVARILKVLNIRIKELDIKISILNKHFDNKVWVANILEKNGNLTQLPAGPNNAMNYFAFEEKFRGSTEDIKKRQSIFLDYFRNGRNVIDIGSGRGEFLSLLKDNGIGAKGIDMNEDMVLYCQKLGLDAKKGDALSYLSSLKDNSLDGVFSGQVVEHLQPIELINLIKLCYDKMKTGTYLVIETINPLCLSVFAESFYLDMSHVKPVHPVTLEFLMESVGFKDAEFKFFSPYPEESKLGKFKIDDSLNEKSRLQFELMNQNIDKLNKLLYGYQDYAVIGKK